ncbi:transmembrane protease serine 13-like [Hoplias malabaricus]|uniref:transmembrane protease serine 13-like n=1 Tax=Hoplias malabaricus TaxID=27720 RepID=UPI0034633FF3
MEDTQTNIQWEERPPPYYSVVKPNEPPPPYVFAQTMPSTPAFVPFYIHHPLPPTPAPHTPTLPSIHNQVQAADSSQTRLVVTQRHRARCYGGSGGCVLILVLIAIAVWLGVRYGMSKLSKGSQLDSCPTSAVFCDGQVDCMSGSDEYNCVRFGTGNELQVLTSNTSHFLPVCVAGWSQSLSDQTCQQLGFRGSYPYKTIVSSSPLFLFVSDQSADYIQGRLQVSSSCPGEKTASLLCSDCGNPSSTSRILGGYLSSPGQWPWQASLHYMGSHTCGGSLISQDFILTAAHCFPRDSTSAQFPSNWRVYLGVVSLNLLPSPYSVDEITIHELYNSQTNDYDIALLKLSQPVNMSSAVHPVCLPTFNQIIQEDTLCWTSGFGSLLAGAVFGSSQLIDVAVEIMASSVCNSPNVYNGRVTQNMLCAGDLNGGKDSCQGDSGGPLVCQEEDGLWYLTGVTSWGEGCGQENSPGVYTNVQNLITWIHSKMEQERP